MAPSKRTNPQAGEGGSGEDDFAAPSAGADAEIGEVTLEIPVVSGGKAGPQEGDPPTLEVPISTIKSPGSKSPEIVADDQLLDLIEMVVLGERPHLTSQDLEEKTGIDAETARAMWVAMGFASVPGDVPTFCDADAEALRDAVHLMKVGGLEPAQQLRMTRVASQSMATTAAAHVESLTSGSRFGTESDAVAMAQYGLDLLPILDRLLPYLYRRHLVAAAQRAAVVGAPTGEGSDEVAVGFADLSGFTRASDVVSEDELTTIVDAFLTSAADIVADGGGRVVKLIGDEVMYTVTDPASAAEIALRLIETGDRGPNLPVHAGVARGRVVNHQGDVFGTTVNLASRLTDASRAGRVLINDSLAQALSDDDRFRIRRSHIGSLKHVGHVRAFTITRARPPAGEEADGAGGWKPGALRGAGPGPTSWS